MKVLFQMDDEESFIYRDSIGDGSDLNPFTIFISNKGLFKKLFDIAQRKDANGTGTELMLHIDATYKTNELGYYLVPCGVSDRSGQFHLLFYGVTSHQREEVP
jgi:hypothetical protein